jgi:hypothetical protein
MIYDHRTYACRPGAIKKHFALYASTAMSDAA